MANNSEISTTVQRAITIINFLSNNRGPQGLKDICENLKLSTTVGHRLLTTLKNDGLVFQDKRSKLYSLGWKFVEYANKLLAEIPIAPIIEPWLINLRDKTNETVGFYVPSGSARICILECESKQDIRRTVGAGSRFPIYRGAGGRTILAYQSNEIKENILKTLSVEEKDRIQRLLQQTAKDGYEISEQETSSPVSALAAPVFDNHGSVIGSLSISGPIFRWNRETMQPFISDLLEVTQAITRSLE